MVKDVTYRTILQSLIADFESTGRSYQQIRNHESVLNKWICLFGTSLDSPPIEFADFNKNLSSFFAGIKYAEKSIPSTKYFLRNFYKIYLKIDSHLNLPKTFPERLNFLMKRENVTCKQAATILGVSKSSIYSWSKGIYTPSMQHLVHLSKLEQQLKVDAGTLVNFIKHWRSDIKNKRRRDAKTQYSKLQRIRARKNYRLQFNDWPEKAREQWTSLQEHHTSQKAPILPRNPSAIWHKENTVKSRQKVFEYFFGFLTLSVDKGGFGLDRSLCDLRIIYEISEEGNLKFFEPYMDFHRKRTICETYPKGVYSKTLEKDLKTIAVFINSKNGFMRNSKKFKDFASCTGLQWDELCDKAMNRITALCKNTKFQQIRYPNEPIAFILNDQHPLKFLTSLVHNLRKNLPTSFHRFYYRKLLNMYFVCAFLSAIPLRAQMLCNMRLNKNIYKHQNGNWRVKFDAEDFKNHRFAAKDSDYDVECPKWLQPIIELYLKSRLHYPGGRVINGELECDYVIRPCSLTGSRNKRKKPIDRLTLFNWCITATSHYIPGCVGFGPQAWRHIVATDWIKNNPNGIQIAAKLLHDRIGTVMKTYQHLMISDWLSHYNIYSDSHFLDENKQEN